MKVLQYRGKSLISKGIQWQTRSPYSHSAIWLDDKSVIEAWHKGGVRKLANPFEGHSDRTVIDVYSISGDFESKLVERFLERQIGKKYDFWAIGRFLSRRAMPANDKWFCSELVVEALRHGGLNLLNGPASVISPRDVALSPKLQLERTLRVE